MSMQGPYCNSITGNYSNNNLNNWTSVVKKRRVVQTNQDSIAVDCTMPPDQMEPLIIRSSTSKTDSVTAPDTSIYRLAKLKYGRTGCVGVVQSRSQDITSTSTTAVATQVGVKRKVQEVDVFSETSATTTANATVSSAQSLQNAAFMTFKQPLRISATTGVVSSTLATATAKTSSNVEGDYNIMVGETLRSLHHSYEVVSFLGRGTFGQVVKAWRKEDNTLTAVKILKNHPSYARQGHIEIQILQQLSKEDTAAYNLVRALECFSHKNHMCLVFELLEQNLYDYLKSHKFRPLQLKEIRPITEQVLTALSKLSSLGLIHADLKPENIMLVNPNGDATCQYRVKVIDFGSACYAQKAVQSTYLQSRYYRAPEILLGLPFTEAIDMWSLGCVIAELFLGWPLYPGSSEYDQIRYITETQGYPSNNMLKLARKTNCFFTRNPYTYNYELKTQQQNFSETRVKSKEARKYILSSLEAIVEPSVIGYAADLPRELEIEREDRREFVDLLQHMLKLECKTRVRPDVALQSAFIRMSHLHRYPHSKRLQESETLMKACYSAGRACVPSTPTPRSPSSVGVGLYSGETAAAAAAAFHPLLPAAAAAAAAFNPMYSPASATDPFGSLCMLNPHTAFALQTGYQQIQKAAALRAIHLGAAASLDSAGRYLMPVVNPYQSLGSAEAAWDQAIQYAAVTAAARQRAAAYASTVHLPSPMYAGASYVSGAPGSGALAAAAAAVAAAAPPAQVSTHNLTFVPPALSLHAHHILQQQQHQQHHHHQHVGFLGNDPIVISDSDDDNNSISSVMTGGNQGRNVAHHYVSHLLQGIPMHSDALHSSGSLNSTARCHQVMVGPEKRAVAICAPFNVKEEAGTSSTCTIDFHNMYVNSGNTALHTQYMHSFGLSRLPQ